MGSIIAFSFFYSPLLLLLILFIAFVFPYLKNKKKKGAAAQTDLFRPGKPASPKKEPSTRGISKKFFAESSSALSPMMEDRKHDWLARQLADESKVRFGEEMLDLGAYRKESPAAKLRREHRENCAAGKLRQEHHENCAAEELKKVSRQKVLKKSGS